MRSSADLGCTLSSGQGDSKESSQCGQHGHSLALWPAGAAEEAFRVMKRRPPQATSSPGAQGQQPDVSLLVLLRFVGKKSCTLRSPPLSFRR